MSKLIRTKSCPFSLLSWRFHKITKVYAGSECIMALTENGHVLQKVTRPELAEDTAAWGNIRDISVSQLFPGLAMGITHDGTCVITKPGLQHCREITGIRVSDVLRFVDSLRDIVKVCISDAIFALDRYGKVHYMPLSRQDDYQAVSQWQTITHIAVGSQGSVFGITAQGTVLCAGAGCVRGPRGDLRETLSGYRDVVDICGLGSECNRVVLALTDGTLADTDGLLPLPAHKGKTGVLQGNCFIHGVLCREDTLEFIPYHYPNPEELEAFRGKRITSFAAGFADGFQPFIIAVTQ